MLDGAGVNFQWDAIVLDDGTYKDTISILKDPNWTWPSYMSILVHEILHGTERINYIADRLAENYIGDQNYFNEALLLPPLSRSQKDVIRELFEEAAVRKYVERMAELNPSLIEPTIFIEPLSEGGSGRYRRP